MEQLATDPRARHDQQGQREQQGPVGAEGEARHPEDQDLDRVAQALAGCLRAHQGEAGESQIEKEGGDQRPCLANCYT